MSTSIPITSCDLCDRIKRQPAHWSTWGNNIVMGFKAHPAIQSDIVFEDLCETCAIRLKKVIFTESNLIRKETFDKKQQEN